MHSSFHRKVSGREGMSLVEIVIVVGILGALAGLAGAFQAGTFRMNRIFGDSIAAVQDGNRAAREIVTMARPLAQSSSGVFPIAVAATSTFSFYVDSDGDGLREKIRYFIDGDILRRGTIVPSGNPPTYSAGDEELSVIARGIANGTSTPLFQYFDRSFSGTSTPLVEPVFVSVVRHVRATIVIDENPSESPAPVTVRAAVTFRNLKDN